VGQRRRREAGRKSAREVDHVGGQDAQRL
jgi:hypothetical protein